MEASDGAGYRQEMATAPLWAVSDQMRAYCECFSVTDPGLPEVR